MPVAGNSTVRWFHSGMANAPQINANATGELIAILDACLVSGFDPRSPDGDKITMAGGVATVHFSGGHDFEKHAVIEISGANTAALNDVWRVTGDTATTFTFDCPGIANGSDAGTISVKRAPPGFWEKAHTGTDKAAYRSTHEDATGLLFRIIDDQVSTGGIRIRGFESMTNVDTGTRLFPTVAQVSDAAYCWRKSNTTAGASLPRPWTLVADESFVWFFVDLHSTTTTPAAMYHFGDVAGKLDDAFRFVITGHTTATPASPGTSINQNDFGGSLNAGCYFARNAAGAQPNPSLYVRHGGAATGIPGTGPAFPDALTGGYLFSPVMAGSDGTLANSIMRGLVPGILQSWTHATDTLDTDLRRVVDPSTFYNRAVMVVAVSSGTAVQSHVGVDIFGPWR